MTSIPRESVPSLPRPEALDRPLLEGAPGRGGVGFEDFLFSLADPAAQAFFANRSAPEPASKARSDDSRDRGVSQPKQEDKSEAVDRTEPESRSSAAAPAKSATSRTGVTSDLNDGLLELPETAALMAQEIPLTAGPELPSELLDDESTIASELQSGPEVALMMVPAPSLISDPLEVSPESVAATELVSAKISEPIGSELASVPAALSQVRRSMEAVATGPITVASDVSGVEALADKPLDKELGEFADSVSQEAEVKSLPLTAVKPSESPGTTAATLGETEPSSEPRKKRESGGGDPLSFLSGASSYSELPATFELSEFSAVQSTEAMVETATAALGSSSESTSAVAREPHLVSTTPGNVSTLAAPSAAPSPVTSPPVTTPAPVMSTPPSRWLQGGEYRRFLHRMDRAFELADQRGGEIRLRLSPPRLGSIRLEMRLDEERMVARIETDSEETRQILLEQFPVLRERLAERGVAVESFQVETRREGDSNSADQRDEARQRRFRRADDSDVSDVSARVASPIVCRLPMVGNRATGLDVIV